MSLLSSHLKTIDWHRELAELEAKTYNLKIILAHTDPNDTAAQADLGTMIHFHEIYIATLKAKIELMEEWEDFPDKPDQGGRRNILEQTLRDWDDAKPLFQEKGREVQERIRARARERESKQAEAANPNPAPPEPERIPWPRPKWELAAHIIELHEKGELGHKGQSKREVVMQNADRFIVIDKNGNQEKVNPDSIWRNYFQRLR